MENEKPVLLVIVVRLLFKIYYDQGEPRFGLGRLAPPVKSTVMPMRGA